ncbi:HIT family protein [Candidatus Parcubacteria bacterium]|nr:HIT family protein [Candidatus Parcubacteria bacterium]
MDCIFCKIISGEIPSAKVFEDENVLAFLDVNPDSKGHTLVIPKQHAENIFDISKESLENVIVAAKHIAKNLKDVLHTDGINLMQSNGPAANQVVMHYHLHIIPRYENDGLKIAHKQEGAIKPPFEELQALAKEINP